MAKPIIASAQILHLQLNHEINYPQFFHDWLHILLPVIAAAVSPLNGAPKGLRNHVDKLSVSRSRFP